MSAQRILDSIDKANRRTSALPEFRPGDSVKVWAKIREGDKTRLQAFEGVCIRRTSRGTKSTFTVRKISYGVGVERVFPDNSPNIDRIEVIARGRVNRSRLYFLRDLQGKAARIKEREGDGGEGEGNGVTEETASDSQPEGEPAEKVEKAEKAKGRGKRKKNKASAASSANAD